MNLMLAVLVSALGGVAAGSLGYRSRIRHKAWLVNESAQHVAFLLDQLMRDFQVKEDTNYSRGDRSVSFLWGGIIERRMSFSNGVTVYYRARYEHFLELRVVPPGDQFEELRFECPPMGKIELNHLEQDINVMMMHAGIWSHH